MREFTLGHLGESRSAPGGRQLVDQAANLTFESACGLLWTKHSPIAILWVLNHEVDTHLSSLGGWKTESTWALQSVCNLCPKLRFVVIIVKNAEACPRRRFEHGISRAADKRATTRLDHCDLLYRTLSAARGTENRASVDKNSRFLKEIKMFATAMAVA